jgi:hypothetical protein
MNNTMRKQLTNLILITLIFSCKEKATILPENVACRVSSYKEFSGQELKISTQTKYNKDGDILEYSSLIDGTKYIYEYQNKRKIIKFFDKNNILLKVSYIFLNDDNKNESVEHYSVLNGKETLISKTLYTYHNNKKLATSSEFNSQNKLSTFYSYDENGRIIEVKRNWDSNPFLQKNFYNTEGFQIKYEETNNGITSTSEYIYEFNQNNKVSKKINYFNKTFVGYTIYEYSLNQSIESTFNSQNVLLYKISRIFDTLNRVVEENNTNYSNGKVFFENKTLSEYLFDTQKLIKTQLIYPNENNRNITVITTFDKNQNTTSTTSYDFGNKVLTRFEYTYDCN